MVLSLLLCRRKFPSSLKSRAVPTYLLRETLLGVHGEQLLCSANCALEIQVVIFYLVEKKLRLLALFKYVYVLEHISCQVAVGANIAEVHRIRTTKFKEHEKKKGKDCGSSTY